MHSDTDISHDQAILAVLAANPHAFSVSCNAASYLKSGVILEIPSLARMRALSRAEAEQVFARQKAQWRAYRATGEAIRCPPPPASTLSESAAIVPGAGEVSPEPQSVGGASGLEPKGSSVEKATETAVVRAPLWVGLAIAILLAMATMLWVLRRDRGAQPAPAQAAAFQGQVLEKLSAMIRRGLQRDRGATRVSASSAVGTGGVGFGDKLSATIHRMLRHDRRAQPVPAPSVADPQGVDFAKLSLDEACVELSTTPGQGLTQTEAQARLDHYGPNALEEKKKSHVLMFLSYFWGPVPWMIEIAAILSALVHHWDDFIIITVMLLINAVIGYVQESKAADAIEALKASMALKARVLRDGRWADVDAQQLVPGDVLELRLGNVIPADVKLAEGDYLSVDQAALTGESLPVSKKPGDCAYSGSVIKQGEMTAVVTTTGANTCFGHTARLVASAGAVSHFQKAVMKIGDFLILVALGLSAVLILVELHRGEPVVTLLQFVLILIVASIPVAMPAVLSVTMALGALALSKKKAVVSRLQAIEEMAGVDMLCSDKTGTLTRNQLTLGDPISFAAKDGQALILCAALASKEDNGDAIDMAVIGGLEDKSSLQGYQQLKFVPFDPLSKRTVADVRSGDGSTFRVAKGAPQVILAMSNASSEDKARVMGSVDELAAKGYRALAVARTEGDGAHGSWELMGVLSLFDPPRDDAKETIAHAHNHGIDVKMITGDDVAIGRQIAGQLGMGANVRPANELFEGEDPANLPEDKCRVVEKADGFGRVVPEHKYGIVKALQKTGHLTAMTGDGVNDAPALKQADVGVAVSGATDAARSAADLVLTAPGLSVIIDAVDEARRIFQRMMSYVLYRIAMTMDIMLFVALSMMLFDQYPLTAIMIILLALLNDIPIMSVAYDNTRLSPMPVRWQMGRVLTISSVLGFLSVIQTFGLYLLGMDYLQLEHGQLQTLVFLQLLSGGALMLLVTRNQHDFWQPPFPAPTMLGAILSTQVLAVVLVLFGWLMPALPAKLVAAVWAYNLVWMVFNDIVKVAIYRLLDMRERHRQRFLQSANTPLQQFGKQKMRP